MAMIEEDEAVKKNKESEEMKMESKTFPFIINIPNKEMNERPK
jgi:vacuolar-type H+-ATPase subunit F/Vma7